MRVARKHHQNRTPSGPHGAGGGSASEIGWNPDAHALHSVAPYGIVTQSTGAAIYDKFPKSANRLGRMGGNTAVGNSASVSPCQFISVPPRAHSTTRSSRSHPASWYEGGQAHPNKNQDTSYLLPHGVQSVKTTSLTLVFEQITDVDRRLFRKMISPRPLINSGTMILLNGRQLQMQSE